MRLDLTTYIIGCVISGAIFQIRWLQGLILLIGEGLLGHLEETEMKKITLILAIITLLAVAGCGKQENSQEASKPPSMGLHIAAALGNLKAIQQHIQAGSDLNEKDAYGSSPLIVAATFGKTEAAKALIEAGADMKKRNNDGSTALHIAAFLCYPEIVDKNRPI